MYQIPWHNAYNAYLLLIVIFPKFIATRHIHSRKGVWEIINFFALPKIGGCQGILQIPESNRQTEIWLTTTNNIPYVCKIDMLTGENKFLHETKLFFCKISPYCNNIGSYIHLHWLATVVIPTRIYLFTSKLMHNCFLEEESSSERNF